MKLSVKALIVASGVLWGGAILCLGLIHLANPPYGASFLDAISSIYPGFHGARNFPDVLVGTAYALIDGGLGGLFLAWLYNLVVSQSSKGASASAR